MGTGESDVRCNFDRALAKFFCELFLKRGRDGDDRDLDGFQKMALLVGSAGESEVGWDGDVGCGHIFSLQQTVCSVQCVEYVARFNLTVRVKSYGLSNNMYTKKYEYKL